MQSQTSLRSASRTLGLAALLAIAPTVQAQTAYGVDAAGALFSFNLSNPGSVSSIGSLGITPDAIDFRPGTSTLYAIDVNSVTGAGQLYTINTGTGAASAVGAGFVSAKLIGASSIGFDFNPTTLQGDGSIRIRLTSDNSTNLRLHSDTGAIAATDTDLTAIGVTGSAYTNTASARLNGTVLGTTLFDINSTTNFLVTQVPPNAGQLNDVGSGLGVDVGVDIGFDIYSGGSTNIGYIVDTTGANTASYYSIDLTTGSATSLGVIPRGFSGGFAIDQLSAVPEPSTYAAAAGLAVLALAAHRRRRAAKIAAR